LGQIPKRIIILLGDLRVRDVLPLYARAISAFHPVLRLLFETGQFLPLLLPALLDLGQAVSASQVAVVLRLGNGSTDLAGRGVGRRSYRGLSCVLAVLLSELGKTLVLAAMRGDLPLSWWVSFEGQVRIVAFLRHRRSTSRRSVVGILPVNGAPLALSFESILALMPCPLHFLGFHLLDSML